MDNVQFETITDRKARQKDKWANRKAKQKDRQTNRKVR